MKAHLIFITCLLLAAPTITHPDHLDPSTETTCIANAGESYALPHFEHIGPQ